MKNTYAITDGIIFTGCDVLKNHALIINEKFIDKIVQQSELDQNIEKISADGRLIVPGFVNAHHHFYSALATGLAVAPCSNFLDVLENLWWKLDAALTIDDVRLSAKWTIAQCVKNGVTTVFDHHASYNAIPDSLNSIKSEIESAGIRGVLCFETSDRNGEEKAVEAINENVYFEETENVKKLFGLHAAFTISDKTFEKIYHSAWENAGFHIHCAEDKIDVESANGELIKRLDKFSILQPNSLLIHGIHLRDDELKIIAEKKSTLVHCPDSNMHNGVGNFDLVNANEIGVKIAAGTDGMYSNMLRAYKTAYELSRSLAGKPNVGFDETFQMYKSTQELQSIFFDDCNQQFPLSRGWREASGDVISFENGLNPPLSPFSRGNTRDKIQGGLADIAILDYRPHTSITIDNIWGHLLYGAAENPVFGTIASGKILKWDNKLKYLDEEKLAEECRTASGELWEKL